MPARPTFRFIRAVHRRLIVMRALERIGLSILLASGAGLLLIPVLMWNGKSGLPLAGAFLVIGAIMGVMTALTRRPTALQAAMEADRQLNLADLLSTALRADLRDPWAAAVVAMADHACRDVRPSSVLLNRYGARAWGGIGLASALVLTLAMISARAESTRADELRRQASLRERSATATTNLARENRVMQASTGHRTKARDVEDESQDRPTMSSSPANDPATATRSADASNASHETSDPTGGGSGAGRSRDSASDLPRPSAASTGGHDESAGTATGGGAGMSRDGNAGNALTGSSAGVTAGSASAAPWENSNWGVYQQAAGDAIRSGRVPDPYRQLVQDYFDRE